MHASTHLKADTHASQLCGTCLSSAPLQNMAGGGASICADIVKSSPGSIDCDAAQVAPRFAFTAFRSRAPPTLL